MFPKMQRDPSQPTQAELDHTEMMNLWWVKSFNNSFIPNLRPVVKEMKRDELKHMNALYAHVNRELAHLHLRTAVLTRLAFQEPDGDKLAKRFTELRKALDVGVTYTPIVLEYDNDKPDSKPEDETPEGDKTPVDLRNHRQGVAP